MRVNGNGSSNMLYYICYTFSTHGDILISLIKLYIRFIHCMANDNDVLLCLHPHNVSLDEGILVFRNIYHFYYKYYFNKERSIGVSRIKVALGNQL